MCLRNIDFRGDHATKYDLMHVLSASLGVLAPAPARQAVVTPTHDGSVLRDTLDYGCQTLTTTDTEGSYAQCFVLCLQFIE